MKKAGVQAGQSKTSKDTMSISHDSSAATTASADGKVTPKDHIVQCAHNWNADRKQCIAAPAGEKTRAKSKLYAAEQRLSEACDRDIRKGGQP